MGLWACVKKGSAGLNVGTGTLNHNHWRCGAQRPHLTFPKEHGYHRHKYIFLLVAKFTLPCPTHACYLEKPKVWIQNLQELQ